ncbi:MAG: ATPase, T2SS/T4P/T4SS family [Chloroflexota bacterium]
MTQEKVTPLTLLQTYYDDPEISQIYIDGYQRVYVERKGQLADIDSPFQDQAQLLEGLGILLADYGLKLDESHPMVYVRLFDGTDLNIVGAPIALNGPAVTLRKRDPHQITVDDLLKWGAWTPEMVQFLQACVEGGLNVLISGGYNSGKTTVLNLLANMIPHNERIILAQRADDVTLSQPYHVVVETRPPNLGGKGAVSMRDLVENSYRMHPSRLIITELMGAEALPFVQAMNQGSKGNLATIQGNSIRDAFAQLETLLTSANPALPLTLVRTMMANSIDVIVQQSRMPDGSRKVTHITEVESSRSEQLSLSDIFVYEEADDATKPHTGQATATGIVPQFLSILQARGVDLPISLFTPKPGTAAAKRAQSK